MFCPAHMKGRATLCPNLDREQAVKLGNSWKRPWRVSGHYQLNFAMPQKLFTQSYGLVVLR